MALYQRGIKEGDRMLVIIPIFAFIVGFILGLVTMALVGIGGKR